MIINQMQAMIGKLIKAKVNKKIGKIVSAKKIQNASIDASQTPTQSNQIQTACDDSSHADLLLSFGLTKQLIDSFSIGETQIISNPYKNRIQAFSNPQNISLDVRDQRVKIPLESEFFQQLLDNKFKGSIQPFMDQVRDWLVDVIEIVTSVSFNLLKKGQLTQKQVKNFAAKNILLNIKEMLEKYHSLPLENRYILMGQINKEVHAIFKNIIRKYPQTSSKGASRRIRSKILKIDNRENDEYDFLLKNNVNIKYKKSGDYSEDIMKVINKLVSFTTDVFHPNDQNQETNYEVFTQIMEYIYEYSSNQSPEQSALEIAEIINRKTTKANSKNNMVQSGLSGLSTLSFSEKLQKRSSFSREGVPKNYIIGQKIPSNTQIFSEQDLEGSNFKIFDSSILRILTKWSQELKGKLQNAEEHISKRLYKFKTKNQRFINLELELRQMLYEKAKSQNQEIIKFMDLIIKENHYLQTIFAQQNVVGQFSKHDTKIGVFVSQINDIAGHYIFKYLNKLIHSVLLVPRLAAQQTDGQSEKNLLESINLLTFKIGDLMRSKCSCSEQQFIKILNVLEQIEIKNPEIIKIVRIKNRLDQKDNDVLINIFFMNKIECEVQLSIMGQQNKSERHSSYFNHFLYQIIRADLGPISELANIVGQYDPLISLSCKNKQMRPALQQFHYKSQRKKQFFHNLLERLAFKKKYHVARNIELPFVCCMCLNLTIIHNPHMLYRDPNDPKLYCMQCALKNIISGTKVKQTEYVMKHSFKTEQERIFYASHLDFWDSCDWVSKMENDNDQCEMTDIPQYGLYVKTSQKVPRLSLFSMTFQTISNAFLMCKFSKEKIKLVHKFSIYTQNKKRIQSFKKEFSKFFIFKFQNIKQTINNGRFFITCTKEGCCQRQIQVGRVSSSEEVINFVHQKYIDSSLRSQKSILSLNTMPNAFQRLEQSIKVLELQLDGRTNRVTRPIEIIKAYQSGLTNIQILSKFHNLKDLNISDNRQLKSLKGIENCYQLKNLECKNCGLSNLHQLKNLKKIEYLNIGSNKDIKCIYGLEDHTQIAQLFMAHNVIHNLTPLSKCTKLQYLDMEGCSKIKTLSDLNSPKLVNINITGCTMLQKFDLKPECAKNLKNISYKNKSNEGIGFQLIFTSLANAEDEEWEQPDKGVMNYDAIIEKINHFLKMQINPNKNAIPLLRGLLSPQV